jgi:tripartite-type tricarboxylate transporter receptor subunit TctC
MTFRSVRRGAFALLVTALAVDRAQAADFYEGKTIRLIIGNNTSGGYAVFGRLFAQYFGRHIPGNPKIVVQYMPGAGGVVLGNYLANVAAPDGLTIGLIPRGAPFQPLFGNSAAKFKAESFTWLGTTSSYGNDAYCLIVRSDSPYKTLADLQKAEQPVPFGGTAAGDMNTDLVLVAKNVFNLNVRVVRGYQGPGEIAMAMERNEIVGRSFGMVALEMFSSDLVKDGKLRFLVQFGRKRWSGLPDVPTAHELAQSPDDNALIDLAEVPLLLARPYLAPPQIPPEATAILRKAFMETQSDPDYLADNEKLKSDVSPLSGEEIQQLVERIGKTPPALVERYKAAVEAK